MQQQINNMLRNYAKYVASVADFVDATDVSVRDKLIAFDVLAMMTENLGEQLKCAHEVITEYNKQNPSN
jgi:hypothetical protein